MLLLLQFPSPATAEPIGWIERYALADDRETLLRELIPGTEDYYFYHCLHHQVTGRIDEAETYLNRWKKDPAVRNSSLLQGIEDRQRLLTYSTSPDQTIDYLRRRLGIPLNHPAPVTAGRRVHPSTFDDAVLAPEKLITPAVIASDQVTQAGLRYLTRKVLESPDPDAETLRFLLQRIDGPWNPDLARLVTLELKQRQPAERAFGDYPSHRFLTLAELQSLAGDVPQVAASQTLVDEVLQRLRPGGDVDLTQQPDAWAAYLRRIDEYVRTLPSAYDGLKAANLFQILQSDLAAGRLNRETFLRYLRLHRDSPIVPLPRPEASARDARFRGPRVSLATDFSRIALLPPIGDEQPLVRTYLEHFLKDADSPDEFAGLLKPEYLRRVFAETKLLAGIAPADRWFAMLTPEQAKALRERIELTLTPDNPLRHEPDSPSRLSVDVKNIDTLSIRIYEINSESYYRSRNKPIDTDIDLDAMVPTAQREIKYSHDGMIRHRERIELEEISGRGVWIVDLLGGGLRSRALIRRGDLTHIAEPSADGLRLIAIDENRRPVPGARWIFTGHEMTSHDDGAVTLPPTDVETPRDMILRDNKLAVSIKVAQPAESYSLQAAMFLDRQKVRSAGEAEILIRPRLHLSGRPVDPGMLEKVAVTVTATDIDGIATTRRFDDLTLDQDSEATVTFRVPARTAGITAALQGEVKTVATNRTQQVSASQQWDIASIRKQSATHDAHLTRDGDRWVVEVLGLSGEPVNGAAVSLSLRSRLRKLPVEATLQSDDSGRIVLGPLQDVESIELTAGGVTRSYPLTFEGVRQPQRLHLRQGDPLRLAVPAIEADASKRFRLLGVRGDRPESDLTDQLKIEGGALHVDRLEAGEYRLIDIVEGTSTTIVVSDGPVIGRFVAGRVRHLEIPPPTATSIESLERDETGLTIRLAKPHPLTRVHIIASRYHTDLDPFTALRLPHLPLRTEQVRSGVNGYLSGLALGDEYRYVMRRREAAKYPGVMLPQPGLILNPWETEVTANREQAAKDGQAPPAAAEPARREGADSPSEDAGDRRRDAPTPDYDFLADDGIVLANLRPDDEGRLHIPADAIDAMPIVHVVVTDPLTLLRRTVFDSLSDLQAVDLRLADSLDAEQPYAFVRDVIAVSSQEPLDLASLGTAQVQTYSSIGDLMSLLQTLVSDERFAEFRPLADWHRLDRAARLDLYGKLASHELHVFLAVHDPEFFDEIIRPYLANKKEKQFVDHYLLGSDLSPYLEAWRYAELNAAEKAMLARRVADIVASVRREFAEVLAEKDDDFARRRQLIDAALAGRALQEMAQSGFSAEGLTWEARRDPAEGMAFGGMGGMGGGMGADPFSKSRVADGEVYWEYEGSRKKRLAEVSEALSEAPRLRAEDGARSARMMFGGRVNAAPQTFYQQLDATKQWAESHWDRVRVAEAKPELIDIDPFWLHWLEQEENAGVNPHLLSGATNRHFALLALALCGLPLESGDVSLPKDGGPYSPPHPVAVVAKRLTTLKPRDEEPVVLAGQRFERVDASKEDRAVGDEFLIHTPYRGQVIVTNPTQEERIVDVLWQIPAGSIPLAGGRETDSRTLKIAPFQVTKIDYQFYFPAPGEFTHYPASAAVGETEAARGTPRTFRVLAAPSTVDEKSWAAVAADGTADQIRTFLREANLRKIDWNLVLHRLSDRDVYDVVSEVLGENRIGFLPAWGYSLRHRDEDGMRTLLSRRRDLVSSVGPVFRSDLLRVDPIERRFIEHLEYAPLVIPRVMPLREENEIFNPQLLAQYRSLVRIFAYRSSFDDTDKLSLVYYLMLQNRTEEAIATFTDIEPADVETRLQYDYLAAYLALHRADYRAAEEIAMRHTDHPVPRWRARFGTLAEHLRTREQLARDSRLVGTTGEAEPGDDAATAADAGDLALLDRERRGERGADDEPAVEVELEGTLLRIRHRNARRLTLNLYAVDPELLFSKTPFVREDLTGMTVVRASSSEQMKLDAAEGIVSLRLDDKWAARTAVIEVIAGPARATALHYGGTLSAYVSEGYGQLQVTDRAGGGVVEGAYVKVFAKHTGGETKFYKDGYTDLRGRFDFATLSTGNPAEISKFAILVYDPERGAVIREANPPTRAGR